MKNNKDLISSVQNAKIKYLKKIQNDNKSPFFIVETYHLVKEALELNLVEEIYELNNKNVYENAYKITENVLNTLTNTVNPDGVVALCKKPKNNKLGSKIIFLDNVQDPGNVGTIMRNAIAFGFDTLITNVNVFNSKIIRSSQGAIFKINTIKIDESLGMIQELKKLNYHVFMTSLDKDSQDFKTIKYPKENIVIVFGNEGRGINQELYSFVDKKIYIPISFESLNVAVASGIVLNEIYSKQGE